MMYVVGGEGENEILLFSVVLCLRDSLSILLKCVPPYIALLPSLLAISSEFHHSPSILLPVLPFHILL